MSKSSRNGHTSDGSSVSDGTGVLIDQLIGNLGSKVQPVVSWSADSLTL